MKYYIMECVRTKTLMFTQSNNSFEAYNKVSRGERHKVRHLFNTSKIESVKSICPKAREVC